MDIGGYALVIGGGSGIGKACAEAFSLKGARGVMIADIDLAAAESVASDCKARARTPGFRAEAIHLDVTVEESVTHAIDQTLQLFTRIDYCVTCAGVATQINPEVSEVGASEFKRVMDINVFGTFLVTRAISGVMQRQEPMPTELPERGATRGVIVNMGSLASFLPSPGMLAYTASKHAVLGLTRNAALDNVRHGIRVNCVCPSWVDTPPMDRAKEMVPGFEQYINSSVPLGRMARPAEIADAVLFLCSQQSSYTTGCALVIDGGTMLGRSMM